MSEKNDYDEEIEDEKIRDMPSFVYDIKDKDSGMHIFGFDWEKADKVNKEK